MEENTFTFDSILKIQQKINRIPNDQYPEYIYVKYDPLNLEDGEQLSIYLPEIMLDLMSPQTDPETNETYEITFADIWDALSQESYIKITDDTPLSILSLAIIWLGVGLSEKPNQLFQQFDADIIQDSLKERNKLIDQIIDEEIVNVIDDSLDSDIQFTKVTMRENALNMRNVERSGIEAHVKFKRSLNELIVKYKNIIPLESFDPQFETAEYVLNLANENNSFMKYKPFMEYDIFDSVKTSDIVPICMGNFDEKKASRGVFVSGKRHLKVHSPGEGFLSKYYKSGWATNSESLSLILYVYGGEFDHDAKRASVKEFVKVYFSFKKGSKHYGRFHYSIEEENIMPRIERRLNDHLNRFQVKPSDNPEFRKTKLKKSLVVENMIIDPDLIMLLYRENIIMKLIETHMPWSQKKNLDFELPLFGSVEVQMKQMPMKTTTPLFYKNGQLHALTKDQSAIDILITASNDEKFEIAKIFILSFLAEYKQKYDTLLERYNLIFEGPPFNNGKERLEIKSPSASFNLPNIKALRKVDPRLWANSDYARSIASNIALQVIPIREDEVEKYIKMGRDVILWPIHVEGLDEDKQTIPSIDPVTRKPLRVFYTASAKYPHIALVENKGPNADIHPMMPKCQESQSNLIIDQSDWSLSFTEKRTTRVGNDSLKTLKPLTVGRYGDVYGSITEYLNAEGIGRMGVMKSKSSFLHCALLSVDSTLEDDAENKFGKIFDTDQAEVKVRKLRRFLGNYASACLQENPRMSVEEIRAELVNPDVYLDPLRHYRAVEELLGINIFVAVPNERKELLIQAFPYEKFYTRTKRRELFGTIVIIVLKSKDFKNTKHYQCELMVADNSYNRSLFNIDVMQKLEYAVDNLAKSMIIKAGAYLNVVKGKSSSASIEQHIDVKFSNQKKIEIPLQLLKRIRAQYVDSFGKTRAIKIEHDNKFLWLVCPPIEPLSGPTVADEVLENEIVRQSFPVEHIQLNNKVGLKSFSMIKSLEFKNIKFVPENQQLVAIWTTIANIDFYIPLIPSPLTQKHRPLKFEILYTDTAKESEVNRLIRFKKVMNVYIQIMKRLFIKSSLNPEDFIQNYLITVEDDHFITTENGSRIVPQTASFEELITHFSQVFPTFFQDGKLVCVGNRMFENISSRIRHFHKLVQNETYATGNSKRLTDFPEFIENYYVTIQDFTIHNRHQIIYDSVWKYEHEMNIEEQNNLTVVNDLNTTLSGNPEPFIYLHESDNLKALFLIQNVIDGDPSRAATVAFNWRNNKVNSGFETMGIVRSSEIKQIFVETNSKMQSVIKIDDPNEPAILIYTNGRAAAILSLNRD